MKDTKQLKKWYIRKIRKGGWVKIAGKWWHPADDKFPYDGRLDGLTGCFGMYIDYVAHEYEPHCYYHHTEEFIDDWDNDPRWVNGLGYWDFWNAYDSRMENEK